MLMETKEVKVRIQKSVDNHDKELREIALLIHANPELAFNEYKAVKWLTEPLENAGFIVEKGTGGLETAFKASWEGKAGGPTIALLAEYDALPEIGHACGHNIIGTLAVGAAIALKEVCPDLVGKLLVIGTPAEEGGGGKIIMCERGVFEGIDAAILCHPHIRTTALRNGLACVDMVFKYYGKAAHASSAPEKGISALDAVINSFVAINSMRQFFKDGIRVHGIITKGGDAPNIVPDYCEAKMMVRAQNLKQLNIVKEKVCRAAQYSAEAVGAHFEYSEGLMYAERIANTVLAGIYHENIASLGIEVNKLPQNVGIGSSDLGNVGQLMPIIHPYIKIAPETACSHSREFCEAAGSEAGMRGLNQGAKAIAMTLYDIFTNRDILKMAWDEFSEIKKNNSME